MGVIQPKANPFNEDTSSKADVYGLKSPVHKATFIGSGIGSGIGTGIASSGIGSGIGGGISKIGGGSAF